MIDNAGPEGPIKHVTAGMTVVDVDGHKVGSVEEVRMADAAAETAAGQDVGLPQEPARLLADVFSTDSELDQHTQERLARLGYLRVDAKGIFTGDRYVEAGQISEVSGDEVRLSVTKDELPG